MNDGLKDKYRQAIVKILADNPRVERAVLFGSRAMGTYTANSDVDIVLYGQELTLTDHGHLASLMSELTMPQQVDLVLYRTIDNPRLIEHINKYGLEWYKKT